MMNGNQRTKKVTIAQPMVEKHLNKPSNTQATIPLEYQSHANVFPEKEAKQFLPSREWDHWIPLKKDALDTTNAKLFSLPQPRRNAIETWVQKDARQNFIHDPTQDMAIPCSLSQRKMGHFELSRITDQSINTQKKMSHLYQASKKQLKDLGTRPLL